MIMTRYQRPVDIMGGPPLAELTRRQLSYTQESFSRPHYLETSVLPYTRGRAIIGAAVGGARRVLRNRFGLVATAVIATAVASGVRGCITTGEQRAEERFRATQAAQAAQATQTAQAASFQATTTALSNIAAQARATSTPTPSRITVARRYIVERYTAINPGALPLYSLVIEGTDGKQYVFSGLAYNDAEREAYRLKPGTNVSFAPNAAAATIRIDEVSTQTEAPYMRPLRIQTIERVSLPGAVGDYQGPNTVKLNTEYRLVHSPTAADTTVERYSLAVPGVSNAQLNSVTSRIVAASSGSDTPLVVMIREPTRAELEQIRRGGTTEPIRSVASPSGDVWIIDPRFLHVAATKVDGPAQLLEQLFRS